MVYRRGYGGSTRSERGARFAALRSSCRPARDSGAAQPAAHCASPDVSVRKPGSFPNPAASPGGSVCSRTRPSGSRQQIRCPDKPSARFRERSSRPRKRSEGRSGQNLSPLEPSEGRSGQMWLPLQTLGGFFGAEFLPTRTLGGLAKAVDLPASTRDSTLAGGRTAPWNPSRVSRTNGRAFDGAGSVRAARPTCRPPHRMPRVFSYSSLGAVRASASSEREFRHPGAGRPRAFCDVGVTTSPRRSARVAGTGGF